MPHIPAIPRLRFISGLPRAGSTLLAAILRQNPALHAAISSPLCGIVSSLTRSMGTANEFAVFLSDDQRARIVASVFEAFYAGAHGKALIFDTNREWCAHLPALVALNPGTRILCCLRSPAWILDSIERHVQANPFARSRLFGEEAADSVYTRAEHTLRKGLLATPLQALRQAWYGEHASRLIAIRYDSLVARPAEVISRLYELLGEPPFQHDFENLEYEEQAFDAYLGVPGLHTVRRRVEYVPRATILPPDLFNQNDRSFWDVPGQNPRGVTVL